MSQIPGLNKLRLDFTRTKISSRGMKTLIKNTKNFMSSLIEFELCLGKTNLIDEDIIPIFYPMSKVTYIYLSLENTVITNNTIEILASKVKEMKNLEDFRLLLAETNVSIEAISGLIKSLKRIKILYLDLNGIEINNGFIVEVNKIIRSKMKKLKRFYLEFEQDLDQTGQNLLDKIHNDYPFPEPS